MTIVVRASAQSDGYLDWVIFSGLALTGVSIILHAFQSRYFGSGRLIVTNFNVPFLAASALALATGGPGLLASLVICSTLMQFVLTLRLASFRQVFTPAVTGTVIMLVALSAVPFIVERTIVAPEGVPMHIYLAPGALALAVGAGIYLRGSQAFRLWILPITVVSGLALAVPCPETLMLRSLASPWPSAATAAAGASASAALDAACTAAAPHAGKSNTLATIASNPMSFLVIPTTALLLKNDASLQ